MLIAIISDIHDNLANLDICLNWCHHKSIEKIVFCGDTTTKETIAHLATAFSGDIFMVSGNVELYEPKEITGFKNIHHLGSVGSVKIDSCQIGLCHEPAKIKLCQELKPQPNFIFYGHTHKPWLESQAGTIIANPGNLAGTFNQATFASLNTETKDLKLHVLAFLDEKEK